jgi:hypothetical protein
VRGRASEGREVASVQRSRHLHKHTMESNMINGVNDVDTVTISVRQNDTSVFLVGGI